MCMHINQTSLVGKDVKKKSHYQINVHSDGMSLAIRKGFLVMSEEDLDAHGHRWVV